MSLIFISAILISLIFAPLGCIVLWKKYSYFGDGISHASLLVSALTVTLGLPLILSAPLVALFFSLITGTLKTKSDTNSVIGLTSSLMLSSAIVLYSLNPHGINIEYILFGDIISVNTNDILILSGIVLINTLLIISQYRNMMLIILSRELAKIKNIRVKIIELAFLFILSITIFTTIKIVGALMVVSLLIIPPMIARLFSRTPFQMIVSACIISIICNLIGIIISSQFDIPTAPSIVMVSSTFYLITSFIIQFRKYTRYK